MQEVVDVANGFEHDDGTLHYTTDRISLIGNEGQTPNTILDFIGISNNVEAIELIDTLSGLYIITLNLPLVDIVRICQDIFEADLGVACPIFIRAMKRFPNILGYN